MRPRQITEEDIPLVAEWFADKKWEMPPVEKLLTMYGLIAESAKGVSSACCWLYLTDTAVAYLGWFGANPQLSEQEQSDGVQQLILFVQDAVYHVPNIKLLLYYTQNEALAQKFEGLGFRNKKRFIQCAWMPKKQPLGALPSLI